MVVCLVYCKREANINKKFLLGLVIGGAFLFFTVRQIDLHSCMVYIGQANPLWILLAILVYTSSYVVRSIRWSLLVTPIRSGIPLRRFFNLLIIGFFMNNVLPFRLGELVRAHVGGQKLNISRTGMLATIIVERLFDGISYIALFLITILFLPFPKWAKTSFSFGSVVFVGMLVFLYFLLKHREFAVRLMAKIRFPASINDTAQKIFANFIDGLQIFAQGSGLIKVFFISLLVWTIEGLVFYLMGQSFGIQLTIFQCFFVMIIIGMGAIIPTAPGFVGTVEFLGVTSLSFIGVNKNLAFGYIISLHMLQLLTVSVLGIMSLIKEKISISELFKIEKQS